MTISVSSGRPIKDAKIVTPGTTAFKGQGKAMSGIFFAAGDEVTVHFPSSTITFTPDAAQFVSFAPLGITTAGSGNIYMTF